MNDSTNDVHPLLAIDVTEDPDLARTIWANLRELAASPDGDPVWREMAREVVEGRLTAGQLLSFGAYQDAMAGRLSDLASEWDAMPEAERERLAAADEANRTPVEQLVAAAEAEVVARLAATGELSTAEAIELADEISRNARG
jgi:hypothetical protein